MNEAHEYCTICGRSTIEVGRIYKTPRGKMCRDCADGYKFQYDEETEEYTPRILFRETLRAKSGMRYNRDFELSGYTVNNIVNTKFEMKIYDYCRAVESFAGIDVEVIIREVIE